MRDVRPRVYQNRAIYARRNVAERHRATVAGRSKMFIARYGFSSPAIAQACPRTAERRSAMFIRDAEFERDETRK